MKKEEKELLIKFLCEMLPYGVNVKVETTDGNGKEIKDDGVLNSVFIDEYGKAYVCIDGCEYELEDFKPYLRPMSTMSSKERRELRQWGSLCMTEKDVVEDVGIYGAIHSIPAIDWLNKHHFDYRGLIGKGLAIEAPEGMYKIKFE